MDKLEAVTLESEREDSKDEHGSFFLGTPQEPCSYNVSPESIICKLFKRMVVDAFVYHKLCKSRGCTCGTDLAAKASMINQQLMV
jgi:hypothetical protein